MLCVCLDLPIIPSIFAYSILHISIVSAHLFPSPKLHPPIFPSQKGIEKPPPQMIYQKHPFISSNKRRDQNSPVVSFLPSAYPYPFHPFTCVPSDVAPLIHCSLSFVCPPPIYIDTYRIIRQISCPSQPLLQYRKELKM